MGIYNNKNNVIKEIKNFEENKFYDFLNNAEENEIFVRRKILVIDIQKKDLKCSFYENVKKTSSIKIKNLTFLE